MTKSEKLTLLDTADIILDLTVVLNFARWRLDHFFDDLRERIKEEYVC